MSSPFVITICATKAYTYAMRAQASQIVANLNLAGVESGTVVLAGDDSKELKAVADHYAAILPDGFTVEIVRVAQAADGHANYQAAAQLLIARLRTAAFNRARQLRAGFTWSLDSDVLPPGNALRCMLNTLDFDGGYYSVATCPYPNSGFLGGRGTPQHPIAEDFLPHERKLTDEIKEELAANEAEGKALADKKERPSPEQIAKWDATNKKIRECPPDGNIWEVIAKHGWRPRGWLEHAYPAVGRGAVLPSDWCGFGCTLLNAEALALAHFAGYEGKGTEDLFVCWHRWHPAGLRINVITHCPCDHVIWEKKKGGDAGKYTHHIAHHEQLGDCAGHLRTRQVEWREF
jgi:hypothetical protein